MSMQSVIKKYRAKLDLNALDDTERHATAAGVAKLAPSSPLVAANTSIQTSVASLAKKDAALTQSNATVTNDRKQLKADTAVETLARAAFDGELVNLTTLVGTDAKSTGDISGTGLTPFVPAPKPKGTPAVPEGIEAIYPKRGHGKAKAAVQQPKGARWEYLFQTSPNPPTTTSWEVLAGNGKTRTLTGASGTQLWVRAARVRGGIQGEFCTPILVTIP